MAVRTRFSGDTDAAKNLLPTARKLLDGLANRMQFNSLKQDQCATRMSNGTAIKVQRIFGQDTIDIIVPVAEIEVVEVKEKFRIVPEYKIKLTRIHTGEILTPSCLTRMAFYDKEATSIENEKHIVFDYHIPDELDEDGKLLISPEKYFGSNENPGLGWDDAEECFVVSVKDFTGAAGVLDYATALGSDELKHFAVYSCMSCSRSDYREARQNQQYPEIVDDEERWNEGDLIEPSFGDIFEDNIACHIGIYITAKIGSWLVVWDAVLNGYAKGIIDDFGDEVLDSDWPVLQVSVSNWRSSTSYKSSFYFNWGNLCTEDTIEDCAGYPPGMYDELDCEKADYYIPSCLQQYTKTVDHHITSYPAWNYTDIYRHKCTAQLGVGVSLESYYGTMNGFDVLFRWDATDTYNSDQYTTSPGNVERARNRNVYYTLITPWGNLFEDLLLIYEDWGYNEISYVRTCNGEQVCWRDEADINARDRIGRALYQSNNIIFGLVGGYSHKIQCSLVNCIPNPQNPPDCVTILDNAYGLDAWGAIDYYTTDKCSTVDPNVLDGSPDVQEGFINLLQAYFDDVNGGVPQLYIVSFQHREGVT